MNYFNNYSTRMYLYLCLHGSYGILWVLKDIFFPDFKFNVQARIGSCITAFLFLTLYWLIPLPMAAGYGINNPSTARIIFLVCLYITGLVLMLGSDYQKYQALKKKPGIFHFTQDLFLQDSSSIQEIPTTLDKSWSIAPSYTAQDIFSEPFNSMD